MTAERTSALPRKQLDAGSRQRLEFILGKEPAALTDAELSFLWGRRDYLTADERKDYGVDGKKSPVVKKEEPEDPENDPEKDKVGDEGNQGDGAQDKYDVMSKDELKVACKKRGLKTSGTNEELRGRLRA